jgi:2-ketoarginine methyltransferase
MMANSAVELLAQQDTAMHAVSNADDDFENELIEWLQPIRGLALAFALQHVLEGGVYDKLVESSSGVHIEQLAREQNLDARRLSGLLSYLANEHVVMVGDGVVSLTARGRRLSRFRSWYQLLVGGYAQSFSQIGHALSAGSAAVTRDLGKVGIGSCGMSHFDAIPLTQSLLKQIPKVDVLLDLGCGNGRYLVELCTANPGLRAIGVEPSLDGFNDAQRSIAESEFQDRIQLHQQDACGFLEHPKQHWTPDVLVLGFVLHEILGQGGEEQVIAFLRTVTSRYPSIKLIVIEVDDRIHDPGVMQHGLSKAYYNPYYLLHYFTGQRLERLAYWEDLFRRIGLRVVARATTDPKVDSTGLEVGYLLAT